MSKKWKHRVKLVCWTSPGRVSWNLRDKRSSIPNVRLLVLFIDLDPNRPLGISRQMRSVPKNLSSECKQLTGLEKRTECHGTPWPHRDHTAAVPYLLGTRSRPHWSLDPCSPWSAKAPRRSARSDPRSPPKPPPSPGTLESIGISWNQLEVGISWNQEQNSKTQNPLLAPFLVGLRTELQ